MRLSGMIIFTRLEPRRNQTQRCVLKICRESTAVGWTRRMSMTGPSDPGPRNEAAAKLPKLPQRTLKVSNKPRRGSLLKSSGQKFSNKSWKVSLLGSSII